jgi:hypothetical protein
MIKNKFEIVKQNEIQKRIYTIRDLQVMLDSDLAELYGVETKRLNEQVKRNIERFPEEFRFQLTKEEFESLRSQMMTLNNNKSLRSHFATSNGQRGGRQYLPYAFTEEGVAMLSSVLKSETAVKISIKIINSFVTMRKFISANVQIFQRLDSVERKQLEYQIKAEKKFEKVFNAIEEKNIKPKQGIFFDGQIFDAYKFISNLIKTANKSVIIIDNYVDDSVLTLLSKKKKNVEVTILTENISKQLALDLKKYNAQYPPIKIKVFKKAHDRFLIIDNKDIYHFGASLKDLGKKWFAFAKFDKQALKLLDKLKEELKDE